MLYFQITHLENKICAQHKKYKKNFNGVRAAMIRKHFRRTIDFSLVSL